MSECVRRVSTYVLTAQGSASTWTASTNETDSIHMGTPKYTHTHAYMHFVSSTFRQRLGMFRHGPKL